MSNGVRIIPPKPRQGYLRVAGFVSGKGKMVAFEGTVSVKKLKEFDLKPGTEITIKIQDSAGLDMGK